ncbi:MAG TPA: TonB family protein [Candidatus Polarisedimenticolia bacterium]|nr:TonB family protein [Candidatus Polarisedimenticolia bacterium]
MLQPIWRVLVDLGIEAEYCRSAVDAVEKVTTQLFQIVITDWEDQPEATFLLKTARDQKAAQRPLTIAIVSDDAKLPEALQAGANSIIVRPIRPEIVRDTMTTACQLLRSKQPSPARIPAEGAEQPQVKEIDAMAAAASGAGTVSPPVSLPQDSEKTFRAGEFLHGSRATPGGQFDTECEVQKSLDQAAASEVDALTELEPMASAVESASAQQAAPRKALNGWASLQARLTTPEPSSPEPSTPRELLGYGETPFVGSQSMPPTEGGKLPKKEFQDTAPEAALFSYMSGESNQALEPAAGRRQHLGKSLLVSTLAIACAGLVALPRTRQTLGTIYRSTTHAGRNLLNPQPTQVPQTVTQHDSFGQEGDEYKFPVVANIPDATTDPSQIRVLPVIDPTAKVVKGSEAASATTAAEENVSPNGSQGGSTGNGSIDNGQPRLTVDQVKDQAAPSAGEIAGGTVVGSPGGVPSGGLAQSNPPVAQAEVPEPPPRPMAAPLQVSTPPHGVPGPAANGGIPSSLRSQLASMTPEASGAKPVEAAMSSIEPVNLPESAVWDLLIQPTDPIYPDAARAGGQRGSVVLQVLIGRDGSVQDAKFLQGSLVFARAAIDAVKQWRFKPYSFNGRVVSVQSLITLHFKSSA